MFQTQDVCSNIHSFIYTHRHADTLREISLLLYPSGVDNMKQYFCGSDNVYLILAQIVKTV